MQSGEFIDLVKTNKGVIYKLIHLYVDDAELKKDLYQEILYNAWKAWPNFRADAKFSTWLYRVSLNTLLTYLKKSQRLQYTELPDDVPLLNNSKHPESERLYLAIRTLVPTDRAIISMHLEGYNNPEIAEAIGLQANNIGVKLHRIKEKLKLILQHKTN